MNFGERLLYLRQVKDVTQEDMSKALLISRSTISRLERNMVSPKLEDIIKIAIYFNVSLDYLILGKETRTFNHKDINKIKEIVALLKKHEICIDEIDIKLLEKILIVYKHLKH